MTKEYNIPPEVSVAMPSRELREYLLHNDCGKRTDLNRYDKETEILFRLGDLAHGTDSNIEARYKLTKKGRENIGIELAFEDFFDKYYKNKKKQR